LAASAWQKKQQSIDRLAQMYKKLAKRATKVTAILELLLQIRHKRTLFCQLLLLRADDLDQVLHDLLVILVKHYHVLVTLRALCRIVIRHNARGPLMLIF
jgi:hypothetical protein